MIKKNVFIAVGFVSLFLGMLGIFLPVLPTIPFLLLSAYLFRKSSTKWHNFLINNKIFGKYIKDYMENKGITLKNKIIAVSFLGMTLVYSAYKMKTSHIRYILLIIFIGVLVHILKLKTIKN